MTKKSKKLFLLIALVVLAVGVTALSGTFATGVNKIGEPEYYDTPFTVTLEYYDYWNELQGYKALDKVFDQTFPWCPGRTEVLYLKLTNGEKFPVECGLTMAAGKSELNDVFTYAVLKNLQRNDTNHPQDWDNFKSSIVYEVIQPESKMTQGDLLAYPLTVLNAGETVYFAVGLHMSESATNEYANKQLPLTFNLRINADFEPGFIP